MPPFLAIQSRVYLDFMTQWLDPEAHEAVCGTEVGYQQISRARSAALAGGAVRGDIPQYDDACREGWAKYMKERRPGTGGKGGRSMDPADHGTVERYRQETYLRHTEKMRGVPEGDRTELCALCRKAYKDRQKVEAIKGALAS